MKSRLGFMQGRLVDSEKKNSIQFFPAKNWSEELKIAKKLNFKIMEWTINVENMKYNPLFNGEINKVKKIIQKNKITIPSVTIDYFMQKPFFKMRNKTEREKILNNIRKIINNGNKLNIKYFILPLVDNSSIKSTIQEKNLIQEVIKLLKLINKKSYILFEIDYLPNQISKFIKKFKSNKVGINYDTGNSAGLGYDFKKELNYFKYVKNIHIKDRKLKGKTVRLGFGNWQYKKFFKLIGKNYNGNFILQTARSKDNKHEEEILINRNFFKNEFR